MTGFGRGVAEDGELRATVDVRTVNHRFLDLKLRGAPLPAAIEDALSSRIRAAIDRGSVTLTVGLARGTTPGGMRIDRAAAERAHRMLDELARQLGIAPPDLALVLAQPGVVISDDGNRDEPGRAAPLDGDPGAPAVAIAVAALDAALVQLDQMRKAEGAALAAELHGRVDELVALRTRIAVLAADVPGQLARRLVERVKRLTDEVGVDPARIAQEVALLADRADVTEELVRLASHLDQARTLIDSPGAVGRRLDFLVQEIGRELNTIGSKSTTAEITSEIVRGKAALEKIREQTQNVE